MRVLVTGVAGFIGFHVAKRLLERGDTVIGIDCVNDYYDPALKEARLAHLEEQSRKSNTAGYRFIRGDIVDTALVDRCFADERPERVIHLAAQAGVRYSLENPMSYVQTNVVGFANMLETCRHNGVQHLTYASTSSVYGANTHMPYSEHDGASHPLQLYAATKRSNELMAHSYSHLFALPTTGLRFFTVYGPWGRPDMAPMKFARAIFAGEPIDLYNNGDHSRDFTYVDDIVDGVIAANDQIAERNPDWDGDAADPASSNAPYRIYNIGNSTPVRLLDFIAALEEAIGRPAERRMLPAQPGDTHATWADVSLLRDAVGYQPKVPVAEGVRRFVEWYRNYHKV